jgi:hypothetical protein
MVSLEPYENAHPYRHLTNPDQRPLRPPKLLPNKTAIKEYVAGEGILRKMFDGSRATRWKMFVDESYHTVPKICNIYSLK